MASDVGVIYFIAAGCALFGAVTAYLIYNFVQQERAEYYKYKLRKEQMKKDKINYDYVAPKEKKWKLSGPVVDGEEEAKKPGSPNGVPIPAPILAPVHLPPVPTSTPPVAATAVPDRNPPAAENVTQNNSYEDSPFISSAAVAAAVTMGGTAGVGAFATYKVAQTYPKPKKNQKQSKKKKRKVSIKKVAEEDFDDYRNFSPTHLPPPKEAPPKANYTAVSTGQEVPVHHPPQSEAVESVAVESGRRRGLELPRVAVAARDGLAF